MIKKISLLFVLLALCIAYVIFLFFNGNSLLKDEVPVLTVPSTVFQVSVKDKDTSLLKDVKAFDEEDGDITKNVFIEKISSFDSNQERIVTYAVFDSNDNLVRTTRKIKYIDYQGPTISLVKPLTYYYSPPSLDFFKDFFSASSVLDGNISSKGLIRSYTNQDSGETFVEYSITDSCGTKSSLTAKVDYYSKTPNIDIQLKTYLKRLKVGATLTEIAPKDTIKSITIMGINDMSLKEQVELTYDYNPNVPGTYEFIYRIAKANGDYGMTKLVVIIEE